MIRPIPRPRRRLSSPVGFDRADRSGFDVDEQPERRRGRRPALTPAPASGTAGPARGPGRRCGQSRTARRAAATRCRRGRKPGPRTRPAHQCPNRRWAGRPNTRPALPAVRRVPRSARASVAVLPPQVHRNLQSRGKSPVRFVASGAPARHTARRPGEPVTVPMRPAPAGPSGRGVRAPRARIWPPAARTRLRTVAGTILWVLPSCASVAPAA